MRRGTIEDRYRRLLLAYPGAYRRERGDEIVGVALAMAAEEGRDRPTIAERIDLVGHGLLYRARGWRRAGRSAIAGDTLAAVAVTIPALLAARLGQGVRAIVLGASMERRFPGSMRDGWLEDGVRAYLASALWLLVALALCVGLVRVAKVLAPLAVAAQVIDMVVTHRLLLRVDLLWLGAGLGATLLLLTPGLARRGVHVLGRRWLTAVTGGIAVLVVTVQLMVPGHGPGTGPRMGNGLLAWLAAIVVAIAFTRAMTRHHRRLAAFAAGLYVLVAGISLQWVSFYSASAAFELAVWGVSCLIAAVIPLAIVVQRDRLRRAWAALVAPPN